MPGDLRHAQVSGQTPSSTRGTAHRPGRFPTREGTHPYRCLRLPKARSRGSNYTPRHTGARRSAAAATPSRTSSERAHSSCAATSSSSVVESAGRADASISRLASPTAIGAQASSSPTSSPWRRASSRDAVGEPEALGVGGADHAAGHDQLLRAADADDLGEPGGAADVGHEAEARLGQADERVLGEHPQVAGQRELQRAAEADAVDLRDGRLGHLLGEVPGLQAGAAERAQPLGRAERPSPARRRPSRRRTPGRCRAARRSGRRGRRRPRAGRRRWRARAPR